MQLKMEQNFTSIPPQIFMRGKICRSRTFKKTYCTNKTQHSSEIRGLCFNKNNCKMFLYNFFNFWNMKTHEIIFCFVFHFVLCYFISFTGLWVHVNIDIDRILLIRIWEKIRQYKMEKQVLVFVFRWERTLKLGGVHHRGKIPNYQYEKKEDFPHFFLALGT